MRAATSWPGGTAPRRSATAESPSSGRGSHRLGVHPRWRGRGKRHVRAWETNSQEARRGPEGNPEGGRGSSSFPRIGRSCRAAESGARTGAWRPCWATCAAPGSCPGVPADFPRRHPPLPRRCSGRLGKGTAPQWRLRPQLPLPRRPRAAKSRPPTRLVAALRAAAVAAAEAVARSAAAAGRRAPGRSAPPGGSGLGPPWLRRLREHQHPADNSHRRSAPTKTPRSTRPLQSLLPTAPWTGFSEATKRCCDEYPHAYPNRIRNTHVYANNTTHTLETTT